MEFPTSIVADESTRAGRMLTAGDIRVTVIDPEHHDEVTVRFRALLDNRFNMRKQARPRPDAQRNWVRVPLSEATHVFVEVPNKSGEYPDKVGTFYPKTGKFFPDRNADVMIVDISAHAASWLIGGELDSLLKFREESHCGVCGRALTDPASIDRGIGPECHNAQLLSRQTRFPAKALGPSSFMVSKVLTEIGTLSKSDQQKIMEELRTRLA